MREGFLRWRAREELQTRLRRPQQYKTQETGVGTDKQQAKQESGSAERPPGDAKQLSGAARKQRASRSHREPTSSCQELQFAGRRAPNKAKKASPDEAQKCSACFLAQAQQPQLHKSRKAWGGFWMGVSGDVQELTPGEMQN